MQSFNELINKIPDSIYSREGDTHIAKLFKLYSDSCDELLDIAKKLSLLRNISEQKGPVLDEIGNILKMDREGNSDQDYRLLLAIAIQRNISNGSLKTLGRIMRLITKSDANKYDFNIIELYTGTASDTLNALNIHGTGPGYFDGLGFFNPNNGKIPGSFDVVLTGDTTGLNIGLLTDVIDKIKPGGVLNSIKTS